MNREQMTKHYINLFVFLEPEDVMKIAYEVAATNEENEAFLGHVPAEDDVTENAVWDAIEYLGRVEWSDSEKQRAAKASDALGS